MQLPKGFLVSSLHSGIKKRKPDLGLIYCKGFAKAAGFFTTNLNVSYSVTCSKENIKNPIKAVLVNSGNANCFSHKTGFKDTKDIMLALAKKIGVSRRNILIASTGIIGKRLPKRKIISNLPPLVDKLDKDIKGFCFSIITTDTFLKISSASLPLASGKATVLGVAKGAGMIYPNMATMLGFVLTDVIMPSRVFDEICREAVEESFNSISVDGCMSTNDTVLVLSSGKMPVRGNTELMAFSRKLKQVCSDLAKKIVQDGEGASKFIEIEITGARTKAEAKKGAFSLANSNLFKCAVYGENANWGRIVAALGQAGIKVSEKLNIHSTSLKKKKVKITVDFKKGKSSWTVYTSDLTPKYVKINADYS